MVNVGNPFGLTNPNPAFNIPNVPRPPSPPPTQVVNVGNPFGLTNPNPAFNIPNVPRPPSPPPTQGFSSASSGYSSGGGGGSAPAPPQPSPSVAVSSASQQQVQAQPVQPPVQPMTQAQIAQHGWDKIPASIPISREIQAESTYLGKDKFGRPVYEGYQYTSDPMFETKVTSQTMYDAGQPPRIVMRGSPVSITGADGAGPDGAGPVEPPSYGFVREQGTVIGLPSTKKIIQPDMRAELVASPSKRIQEYQQAQRAIERGDILHKNIAREATFLSTAGGEYVVSNIAENLDKYTGIKIPGFRPVESIVAAKTSEVIGKTPVEAFGYGIVQGAQSPAVAVELAALGAVGLGGAGVVTKTVLSGLGGVNLGIAGIDIAGNIRTNPFEATGKIGTLAAMAAVGGGLSAMERRSVSVSSGVGKGQYLDLGRDTTYANVDVSTNVKTVFNERKLNTNIEALSQKVKGDFQEGQTEFITYSKGTTYAKGIKPIESGSITKSASVDVIKLSDLTISDTRGAGSTTITTPRKWLSRIAGDKITKEEIYTDAFVGSTASKASTGDVVSFSKGGDLINTNKISYNVVGLERVEVAKTGTRESLPDFSRHSPSSDRLNTLDKSLIDMFKKQSTEEVPANVINSISGTTSAIESKASQPFRTPSLPTITHPSGVSIPEPKLNVFSVPVEIETERSGVDFSGLNRLSTSKSRMPGRFDNIGENPMFAKPKKIRFDEEPTYARTPGEGLGTGKLSLSSELQGQQRRIERQLTQHGLGRLTQQPTGITDATLRQITGIGLTIGTTTSQSEREDQIEKQITRQMQATEQQTGRISILSPPTPRTRIPNLRIPFGSSEDIGFGLKTPKSPKLPNLKRAKYGYALPVIRLPKKRGGSVL